MNHIDRMLDERSELVIKRNKLLAFMDSELFKELPTEDQELMWEQRFLMTHYVVVLSKRIERATVRPA